MGSCEQVRWQIAEHDEQSVLPGEQRDVTEDVQLEQVQLHEQLVPPDALDESGAVLARQFWSAFACAVQDAGEHGPESLDASGPLPRQV